MKVGATALIFGILTTASFGLGGCGGSSGAQDTPPVNGGSGSQSVMKGYAAFGSQCLSGFNTDPKGAVKLELWSCPLNLPTVELAEPIQPLF